MIENRLYQSSLTYLNNKNSLGCIMNTQNKVSTLLLIGVVVVGIGVSSVSADTKAPGGGPVCIGPTRTKIESCYDTIAEGVSASKIGYFIHVNAGLYPITSPIVIDKANLTIIGAQENVDPRPSQLTTRVPGSVSESQVDGGGISENIFSIRASGTHINGFELRHATGDIVESVAGFGTYDTVLIRYNIIHNSTGDEGIQLRSVSGSYINNNYVYDTAGDGINLCCGSSFSSIQDNEVRDIRTADAAIYVYASVNNKIKRNLVYNVSNNDGIKIGNKDGSDTGIRVADIHKNTVHDTKQDGISIYSSFADVWGNNVYNSTSENGAVYLTYGISEISLRQNRIHDNALRTTKRPTAAGVYIATRPFADTITLDDNRIYGNTPYGLSNTGIGRVTAQNNWWGHTSGPRDTVSGDGSLPDVNLTGLGNGIVGAVDYRFWQTVP